MQEDISRKMILDPSPNLRASRSDCLCRPAKERQKRQISDTLQLKFREDWAKMTPLTANNQLTFIWKST
jgi:hypothetical protein